MNEDLVHIYPHRITKSFRVIMLLIPALVFAISLAILVAIKF